MSKNWWKWALGVLGVLVLVSILVEDPDQDAGAKAKPLPKVDLQISSPPAVVKADAVVVSGTVLPARAVVEVAVDGVAPETADVSPNGEFTLEVDLEDVGTHELAASARVGTRRAVSVLLTVERKLSRAEIAAKREQIRKRRAAAERRRERKLAARIAREERRAERRAAKLAAEEERAAEEEALEAEETSDCDSNYSGCVPVASDVDCEGGSGDGPEYTGEVTVIGGDPYDLDSDGDGTACESY